MKKDFLYEGKAKILYQTEQPDRVVAYFKDDATGFDGTKRGKIVDKGVVNASVSAALFKTLEGHGIATHFIERISDRELLFEKLDIILVEVIVRNVAAGSICKRLGLERGQKFEPPLVEFFYKNDELHDPLIRDDHVLLLGLATKNEIEHLKKQALKVNHVLCEVFDKVGITLVDFKLEFGRTKDGTVLLGDEICPDTCRLWDKESGKVLDKDRFRFDMGEVESAYQEVLQRIGVLG